MNETISGQTIGRDNSEEPLITGGTIVEAENGNPDAKITVETDNGVTITEKFGKWVAHRYGDFGRRYDFYPKEGAEGNRVVVMDRYPISAYSVVLSCPLNTLGGDTLVTEEQFEEALQE